MANPASLNESPAVTQTPPQTHTGQHRLSGACGVRNRVTHGGLQPVTHGDKQHGGLTDYKYLQAEGEEGDKTLFGELVDTK